MEERSFAVDTAHASAGIVVWALHFGVIYSFTALACARGLDRIEWLGVGIITWVVLGATIVAALALLALMLPLLKPSRRRFVDWLGAGLAGFALIGVIYEAIPLALVVPCA